MFLTAYNDQFSKIFPFLSIRRDAFVQNESSAGSASEQHTDFIKKASIGLKLLAILISFSVVLVAGCVSKGALFFMIAQIPMLVKDNGTKLPLEYCSNNVINPDQSITYEVAYGEKETIAWMW